MNNTKKNLRKLSFVFFLTAILFSCYALFFQNIADGHTKSVIFNSLRPEQEAWIMTSLFVGCLGIACFLSSINKNSN